MAFASAGSTRLRSPVNLILKLCSLILVLISAGFWAGAGVDTRPKYSNEQTFVGGAIWTHVLLIIGFIISAVADEYLCIYVHSYLLLACILLLTITALQLIIQEIKKNVNSRDSLLSPFQRRMSNPEYASTDGSPKYDKIYLAIGVCMLLASCVSVADFIVILLKILLLSVFLNDV